MDREADIFSLLHAMETQATRYIIRVGQNRKLEQSDLGNYLFERLQKGTERFRRDVHLSIRVATGNQTTKSHASRNRRIATLAFSAQQLTISRPDKFYDVPAGTVLPLNFVHVYEPQPPEGESPVDWKLVTSEPITTVKDIERIVDGYRKRWVIEEYFKALKTGCAFEKRQLETRRSLENLLGILAPIACNLLAIRSAADSNPQQPAADLITPQILEVLEAFPPKPLPSPTIKDALFAIAALDGSSFFAAFKP